MADFRIEQFPGYVRDALRIARDDGPIDGAHHKMWVIDQMVRALTGDQYPAFVESCRGTWDEGIAP